MLTEKVLGEPILFEKIIPGFIFLNMIIFARLQNTALIRPAKQNMLIR